MASRTVLIVVGVVGACSLCCCGGGGLLAYFGIKKGTATDAEAKAFARKALEAGGDWKPASLKPYLAPTWTQSVSPEDEAKILASYAKRLGSLKKLDEFTTAGMSFGNQNGLPMGTRVNMSAGATFAKGEGTITVRVVKIDERWGIESLKIDSDVFLK